MFGSAQGEGGLQALKLEAAAARVATPRTRVATRRTSVEMGGSWHKSDLCLRSVAKVW